MRRSGRDQNNDRPRPLSRLLPCAYHPRDLRGSRCSRTCLLCSLLFSGLQSVKTIPAVAAHVSVIALLLVVSRNEFLGVQHAAPELLGASPVDDSHSAWKLVASITRICYLDDVHCSQVYFLTHVGENDGCTRFTVRDCHRFRRSHWQDGSVWSLSAGGAVR